MHSTRSFQGAVLLMTLLICAAGAFAGETDDYIPEVTDRVARISFIRGEVQIRRADSQDWERAVLNLPIVEGDEIITDSSSRLEIQFDVFKHLRIAENSQIRIAGLKDEGIAISVPVGTVTLHAIEFDSSRSYFEIDAPKTTVSVQRSGSYRVDAGNVDSLEIFVSAVDGGEARVYSADSGFTVKDGRRARIFIGGNRTGEWDVADASISTDEFWDWSMERDAIIAARIKGAYYDQYYDRDIYGADDLNAYGDWVHTSTYGYIWRPFKTSINSYPDWSPYRYGHWRWVPSYGWTWVNDEPWGWATYHHGRWVWHNGSWYWSPYGYYRSPRSWWHPAIVVVRVIASSVYWYPLPYHYAYYDYNRGYYSRRRGHHRNDRNHHGGGNNNPPTTTGSAPVNALRRAPLNQALIPPLESVPPGSVVTVATSEFGRGKGKFATLDPTTARDVLSKPPVDPVQSPPILPTYGDLNGKVSQEIRSVRPPLARSTTDVQIGAAPRRQDAPLDQELLRSRIRGNREPLHSTPAPSEPVNTDSGVSNGPRRTGAVVRQPVKTLEQTTPPIVEAPPIRNAPTPKQETPAEQTQPPKQVEPVRIPRSQPRRSENQLEEQPVRTPRQQPPPRNDPPPPRNDPPPTRHDDQPPKPTPAPPKNDPPPRNDPPPKSDPGPPKSEPSKPDTLGERKKNGRLR